MAEKVTVTFQDGENPERAVVATITQTDEGTLDCKFKFLPDGANASDTALYLGLSSLFLTALKEA